MKPDTKVIDACLSVLETRNLFSPTTPKNQRREIAESVARNVLKAAEPRTTLDDMPQMHLEWQAWQGVVEELKTLGVDLNKADGLARALRRWGEELVELRRGQPSEVREKALADYRRDYPTLPVK